MTVTSVFHPAQGLAVFLAFLLLGKTPLYRRFRKGSTGVLLLFTALYILQPSVFLLVLFTLYFQMAYYWTAKKHTHFLWITAVGFVHLAIVATITSSVMFPVLFIAYVVVLTQSLLVTNFLSGLCDDSGDIDPKEITRLGPRLVGKMKSIGSWIGGLSVAVGLIFFPLLPRFGRLSFQPTQFTQASVTGFSNEVALGEIGDIQSDNRVALRIFAPAEVSADIRRWRGATLEHWDHGNQIWTSGATPSVLGPGEEDWIDLYTSPATNLPLREEQILVNVSSMASPTVFLPETENGPPRVAAKIRGDFYNVDFDKWSWTCALDSGFEYRSFEYGIRLLDEETLSDERLLSLPPVALPDGDKASPNANLLQDCLDLGSLDADFLERLTAKRDEALTGFGLRQDDPLSVARRLSGSVQAGRVYTTDFTKEESARNLDEFLFQNKAGHCEYFATSLALLLRSSGIPARIVTGFQTGRSNFFNSYQIVRQSDAHSWVEAYIPKMGWVGLDPTPSSNEVFSSIAMSVAFAADIYDYLQLHWNRKVLDYSNKDQREVLASLTNLVGYVITPALLRGRIFDYVKRTLAAILFVLFLFWLFREIAPEMGFPFYSWTLRIPGLNWFGRLRGDRHPVSSIFRQIEKQWSKKGIVRTPSETPQQYLLRIERAVPAASDLCNRFVPLYYALRFGSPTSDGGLDRKLREVTASLLRMTREGKR
jgi:hypothetical protein